MDAVETNRETMNTDEVWLSKNVHHLVVSFCLEQIVVIGKDPYNISSSELSKDLVPPVQYLVLEKIFGVLRNLRHKVLTHTSYVLQVCICGLCWYSTNHPQVKQHTRATRKQNMQKHACVLYLHVHV